ncbi:hypothetical protein PAXINDRAFT_169259 [Paxillus involutus ATCC 200175]|uniref:Uncharacterized protein n=1 Tax=Paxillus involutus ATCC 200175 TaxID=664439 RepID=A0A0C9TYM3_PAXIN|nr:hypothetical protein PAXINDRAFT_169259 [Paxillus involutus ATCC 200175]
MNEGENHTRTDIWMALGKPSLRTRIVVVSNPRIHHVPGEADNLGLEVLKSGQVGLDRWSGGMSATPRPIRQPGGAYPPCYPIRSLPNWNVVGHDAYGPDDRGMQITLTWLLRSE